MLLLFGFLFVLDKGSAECLDDRLLKWRSTSSITSYIQNTLFNKPAIHSQLSGTATLHFQISRIVKFSNKLYISIGIFLCICSDSPFLFCNRNSKIFNTIRVKKSLSLIPICSKYRILLYSLLFQDLTQFQLFATKQVLQRNVKDKQVGTVMAVQIVHIITPNFKGTQKRKITSS